MEDIAFWVFEKFMIILLVLFLLFIIVGIPVLIWGSIQENKHCAEWEYRVVHQEAFYQYIWTGKVMVPVYHPAANVQKNVCVKAR